MKSTSAKIFLSLLFLILACSGAEAAGSRNAVVVFSRISSFAFRQMGATDLMVDIRGNDLPLPQVSSYGNRTIIVLHGVSGEKVNRYENEGFTPLVTDVRYGQNGGDFIITIMTEKPLQPSAVRGVPPCDAYTLLLKTSEETHKLRLSSPEAVKIMQENLAKYPFSEPRFETDIPVQEDRLAIELPPIAVVIDYPPEGITLRGIMMIGNQNVAVMDIPGVGSGMIVRAGDTFMQKKGRVVRVALDKVVVNWGGKNWDIAPSF
jgi:hypothetical protein